MNNLTPSLNLSQLQQNITALQKGGLTNDKVQAYVNNYKSDGKGGYTLASSQTPTESTPSLGDKISSDISSAGNDINSNLTTENSAQQSENPFIEGEGNVEAGVKATGDAFDAVANVGGDIASSLLSHLGIKSQANAFDTKTNNVSQESQNLISSLGSKLNDFITAHPEVGTALTSALGIASGGGQIAGGILTGEGAAEAPGQISSAIKTGTNVATDIIGSTIDAAKNKVFGSPSEQISNIANEWEKPATISKPGFKKIATILEKNPETPQFLAEQGLDPRSHLEDGNYATKESAQALRDTAGKMSNDTLRPSLQTADYQTPRTDVSDIENRAIAKAKETQGLTAGNVNTIVDKIHDEALALKEKYPNGISLEELHDNKINYSKNSGYSPINDPSVNNTATANRSLASSFQKTLEEKTPDSIPVKQFNKYLQKYYQGADYLDALDGKKAPISLGQKVARGTAKAIGAIIGSHLGGLPTEFAGYSIGGALEHAIENMPNPVRSEFLANLQKTNPEAFTKITDYLGDAKTKSLTQLKLPSPSELGTEKNPIITQTPTSYEKGSLRSFNQDRISLQKERLLEERASPMITPIKH